MNIVESHLWGSTVNTALFASCKYPTGTFTSPSRKRYKLRENQLDTCKGKIIATTVVVCWKESTSWGVVSFLPWFLCRKSLMKVTWTLSLCQVSMEWQSFKEFCHLLPGGRNLMPKETPCAAFIWSVAPLRATLFFCCTFFSWDKDIFRNQKHTAEAGTMCFSFNLGVVGKPGSMRGGGSDTCKLFYFFFLNSYLNSGCLEQHCNCPSASASECSTFPAHDMDWHNVESRSCNRSTGWRRGISEAWSWGVPRTFWSLYLSSLQGIGKHTRPHDCHLWESLS